MTTLFSDGQKETPITLFCLVAAVCFCVVRLEAAAADYSEPKDLIGNIFARDTGPRKCLFKSERRSSQSGAHVEATCDYTYPDGSLAAQDRIVYEGPRLVSFEEEELQTAEKGRAEIRPDPKNQGKWRVYFEYTTGQGSAAQKKTASEAMENDTIIDDMIPGFIVSHWDALQSGSPAKFRYIVLSRRETVGFRLVRDGETTRNGKPVIRIKMEPTSIIIARLVAPLIFICEKDDPHRILEYVGRVTPLIKSGNKWKDLDAITVFDWKPEIAQTGMQPASPGPH
jgi:hypothetical protein